MKQSWEIGFLSVSHFFYDVRTKMNFSGGVIVINQKKNAFLKAMLEQSNVTQAIKTSGISKATAYKYLKDPEFKSELDKQQGNCIREAVCLMKGKLSRCAEELLKIVEDPGTADQVKINAVNAVFSAYKNLGETADIQARLEKLEDMLEKAEGNSNEGFH